MATTTRNLIFSIYAHLLLAVGVVIVAVGTYMLLSNLTGRFVMEKYPLGYEENRCDYIAIDAKSVRPTDPDLSPEQIEAERLRVAEETRQSKDECFQQVEQLRTRRQQSDLANALNTLIVGLLVLVPHGWMVARLNRKD